MENNKSDVKEELRMPQLIPANVPTHNYCWTAPPAGVSAVQTTRSPVIVKNYSLDSIAMELQAKKLLAGAVYEKHGVIDINSLNIRPFIEAGVSSEFAHEAMRLRYKVRYLADGASGLRERVEKKGQTSAFLLENYEKLESCVTEFFNRISRETRLSGEVSQLKFLRELTAINTRIPVDVETTTRPPVTSRVNSKPLFKPEIQFCHAFWSFLEGKDAIGYILNEVTLAQLQKNQDDLSFLRQPSPCVLYGREDNPTILNNRAHGKVVKGKNGHLTVVFEPLPPVRKRVENEERLSKFRAPTSFYYFVANIGDYWFLCPPFRILVHMNKQNVIQRQKLEIEAADGQQKVVEISGRIFAVGAFLMTEQLPPQTASPLFHGQFSENLRKCIKGSGDLRLSGLDVLDGLDFQLHLETGRGFSDAALNCWKEHILPTKPPGISSLWEQYSLACVAGTLHTAEELFWSTVNSLKQNDQIMKAWTEGFIPGPLCSFCASEMLRRTPCEAQLIAFHLESGHQEMIVYYKQRDSVSVQQKGPFLPYELAPVLSERHELFVISQIVDSKGQLCDKEKLLKVLSVGEEVHEKPSSSMHPREAFKRQFSEPYANTGRLRSIHDALPDKMQELTVQDMTRTFLAREHMNDNLALRLLQVLKRLEECMRFQRILHICSYHGMHEYWKRLHQEWLQQLAQVDNEFESLASSLKEAIEHTEETSQFRTDLTRHLERLRKCSLIFVTQPPPRIVRRGTVKVVPDTAASPSHPETPSPTVRLLGRSALWGDLIMSGIEYVDAAVLTEEKAIDILDRTAPFPENHIKGKIYMDEHTVTASFPLSEIERLSSDLPMKSVFGVPQRHFYMLAKTHHCQAFSLPYLFLTPYLKKQRDGDRFLFGTLIFCETLPPSRLPNSCATSPSLAVQERIMACTNTVPVSRVVDVLDILFRCYTNTTRRLTEICRNHIYNRLLSLLRDNKTETDISWRQFALDHLPNKYRDSAFTFEEWFFDCVNIVRSNEGIRRFWNEGYILGFMPKEDVLPTLVKAGSDTMYLKFSDSVPGGVLLIALNNGGGADYFHMSEAQYLLSALPKIAKEPIKGTKKRDNNPIKKILAWSDSGQIVAKPFDPDNVAQGDAAPALKARKQSEHPYSRTLEPDVTNCEELIEYSTKIWAQYRTYLEGYLDRESQKPEKRVELREKLESVTKILTEHQQEIERLLNDSMNKMSCSDSGNSTMESEFMEGGVEDRVGQARRRVKTVEESDDGSSSSTEYCPKSSAEEDNTTSPMDVKEEVTADI